MKPVDEPESTEPQSSAALFTLLRAVDPESLLPYTAVREIEAMAGERVLEAVEALRAETQREFKAMHAEIRAEFTAVRAETKAEFKAVRAETQGEFKAIRAETKAMHFETRAEFKATLGEIRAESKAINAAIACNAAAIGANAREMRNLLASQGEVKGELKALGTTYKQMLWVLIGFVVTTVTSAVIALSVQVFGN